MCCLKTRYTGFERGARARERLSDGRGAGYGWVRELGVKSRRRRRGRKEGDFFLDIGANSGGTSICLAAGGRFRVLRECWSGGSDGQANPTVVVTGLLNGRQRAGADVGKGFMGRSRGRSSCTGIDGTRTIGTLDLCRAGSGMPGQRLNREPVLGLYMRGRPPWKRGKLDELTLFSAWG
jgi:hypothetical protein